MIALQQIQYLQSSSSSASSELATSSSSSTSLEAAAAVATMASNSVRINDTCDKCNEPQSSFISEKLMSKVGKNRQHDHGDKDDDGYDDDDDDNGMIQRRDHVVYPVVEIIDNKNSSSFIIKGDDNYVNVIDDDDDDDLCKIGIEAAIYGISADDYVTKSVHDNNEHFIKDYINSNSTLDRNHKNLDDDIVGHNDAYGDDDVNEHTSDNLNYKFDTDDHQIKIEINSSKPKLPLVKSALKSTSSSINSKGFYSSSLKKINKHNSSEKKTNGISQTSHVEATTTSNNNNNDSSSSSSTIKLVDSMIDDIFGSKFKLKSKVKVKKSKATKQ